MGPTANPDPHLPPVPTPATRAEQGEDAPSASSETATWNAWEVFDPRDGQTTHVTDREQTADQIAVEEERRTGEPRDYGRTGMEPDGRGGWRPWRPAAGSRAAPLLQPEVDLVEDDSLGLDAPDRVRDTGVTRGL